MKQLAREAQTIKNAVMTMFKAGAGDTACKAQPWWVLMLVQEGKLCITSTERVNILYKLEPTQTARVFKFASLEPSSTEILVNYKLYRSQQVRQAALDEPEFALNYYDHALDPKTRFECGAMI